MKAGHTILIVDDEPIGQQALEALLLPLDHNLAFAKNGVEALAKAATLIPDLILLDVMMPAMDGFEVCRRLRTHPLLAEVPIIMVTALDDRDSRVQGLEAGADDFITKPFDRVELRARVQTIIRLNRYRRLLLERAKFEWVVEQADDGYLIVSESDTILHANSKARFYLGMVSETKSSFHDSLAQKTFLELARSQYRCEPRLAWGDWPRLSANALVTPRYLMRPESPTANASWLQVDVLNMSGHSLSMSGASRLIRLHDVTAQKALQRDIWQFHGMVAHKLRAPMMGMLNSLDLLARRIDILSRVEIAEVSQIAYATTQRFYEAVEGILQYLEVPTLARHGAGFKLSQLAAMVAEIAADLELKPVTVHDQNEQESAQAIFSKRAMELVLHEILENAKKFHPQHAPKVEIFVSRSSREEAIIKISDDGVSLAPQQLAQLQTPYYQAEKQMTGEVAGMGLGLAMVTSLMWEAGGNCQVYNREPGPGLVVELILPLAVSEKEITI
jgi:DNA-binding response OmpR family regulator/nitrogen-specific signal transduction histidine kinase